MNRWRGLAGCAVLVAALSVFAVPSASAQGVTTAALTGTVRQEPSGEPLVDARLVLRSAETGLTYTTKTNSVGRYLFDNVTPGSGYTLQVSGIGFKGVQITGIGLTLGSRVTRDAALEPQVVQLEEVEAVAYDENPLINAAKTGPSTVIGDTLIQRLPLVSRNFMDLAQTAPQVVGTSVAGQNGRFNNVQIDGGVNNDVFAIGSSGTPGGQSNGKAISVEAIKEFQILVAPFDVRQGSFAGGLVNGITQSGTNSFRGSLFGYHQEKDMTGYRDDPTYTGLDIWQYGGTLGGPIVKNKAWFFGAVDIQSRAAPYFSTLNLTGDDAFDRSNVGFTLADAQRVSDILSTTYGTVDLGDGTTPEVDNPLANVFAKLTFNVADNSLLDISYNYAKADLGQFVRSTSRPGNLPPSGFLSVANMRDGYELTGSGYGQNNFGHTFRAQLRSELGEGFSNEFLAGYQLIRDARDFNGLPLFLVRGGRAANVDGWIAAGGDRFSQANSLDQDILSLTNNLSFGNGSHRFTVGGSGDFFTFRNVFFEGSIGVWQFNSIDSLQAGTPAAFLKNVAAPGRRGGIADFSATLFGVYAQDRWTITDRLNVTMGLRVDLPYNDRPPTNPALVNDPNLPINTGEFPSGNIMWSPRLGFNWSLDQYENTVFRGGVGYFSGRPPYVWISNGFVNTGAETQTLYCTGAAVPDFTVDPEGQPDSCADGTLPSSGAATINYFDPDLKFPQNFRISAGIDQRLPLGMVGTIDFLYSKNVNQFYLQDSNLQQTGIDAEGRYLYGSLAGNTANTALVSTPSRLTGAVTSAIRHTNSSGGRTFSTTFQIQKTFGNNFALNAGYTYANTTDQFSMTSSIAFSNYQFGAVDGALQSRNVTTSFFDVPHKVSISGTVRLPLNFNVSLIYVGRSGDPYAWMVGSDVNADGISGNDLPFIPGDPSQISLTPTSSYDDLQSFIDSQECLADSRGKMLERNSCRNPWQNITSARVAWVTPQFFGGQDLELSLDIFNVLAFMGSDWGITKQVSAFEEGPALLRAAGYDATNQRPIYSFTRPQVVETVVLGEGLNSSRWRMQLGAKYRF